MNLRTIQVVLRTNANVFRSDMASAGVALRAISSDLDKFDKKAATAGKSFTAGKVIAAGLLVLVAGLGLAIAKTIEFEGNMRNVNSISHLSENALARLSGEVIKMSTRLPQSAADLSAGLYDIASSGFQGAEGLEVLNASAEAASAGLSTTATAGKAITAVLNAYGMESSEATRVSDALFSTVNLGVVSFDELAGSIGDYVGMAAAAKIPIEEVGAAIATMTLAGIGASEAGTSLSRVIQSLIDPSDELKAVIRDLGYESGQQALETDGLHTVMEKLRVSTGGNLAILIKLFPEIRAARGALALMSADGENYNKVFREMGTANQNVGATKKALSEQMKGLGFQLDILRNKVMSYVLTLGSALIPKVTALMGYLGSDAFKNSAIGKLFSDLVSIGGNVVTVLGHILSVVGPLAGGLLRVAAVPIVAMFRLFASALEAVTGFLADHKAVVVAIASVYAASLVPSLVLSATTFGRLAIAMGYGMWQSAVTGATQLSLQLSSATTAAGGLRAMLAQVTVGVALAGAAAAVGLLALAWMDARKGAAAYAEEIKKGVTKGSIDTISEYRAAIRALSDENYRLSNSEAQMQVLRKGYIKDLNGEKLSVLEVIATRFGLRKETNELSESYNNLSGNYRILAKESGLSYSAIEALNQKVGADFTGAVSASAPARQQFLDTIGKIADQAGVSKDQLVGMMSAENVNPDQIIADMEAIIEAAEKVGESFAKSTDIIGHFSGAASVSGAEIGKFYSDTEAKVGGFVANITKLMETNLDPAVIMRLLQAGPEAAGPIVQAMVGENSANIIKMVNEGEAALEKISVRATELARLTQTAINSTSSEFSDKLPAAIRISELRLQGLSAIDISGKLGMSIEQVRAIAEKFGIQLDQTGAKVDALDGKTASPDITADDSEFSLKHQETEDRLSDLDGSSATPDVNANPENFNMTYNDSKGKLGDLASSVATSLFRADHGDVVNKYGDSKGKLSDLARSSATSLFRADHGDLTGKWSDSKGKLSDLSRSSSSSAIRADNSDVHGKVSSTRSLLAGLAGTAVSTFINVVRRFINADGGYYPAGAVSFARGTEDHRAQMGNAITRVWNEPETEGEAYIPLALRKRAQSMAILEQVASEFGYALTALEQPRSAGSSWAGFRAASSGGAMGSPGQVEALRAELGAVVAAIRDGGGGMNLTIQNLTVRGIVDFTDRTVATRQVVVALDGALEELHKSRSH